MFGSRVPQSRSEPPVPLSAALAGAPPAPPPLPCEGFAESGSASSAVRIVLAAGLFECACSALPIRVQTQRRLEYADGTVIMDRAERQYQPPSEAFPVVLLVLCC